MNHTCGAFAKCLGVTIATVAKRLCATIVACAVVVNVFTVQVNPVTAATAPGTQITNNASATYKDASGNSYSTTSNTVTTIVQNAATISETAGGGSDYAPGQVVTDTFLLSNTGNASGNLQVGGTSDLTSPTDAALGGTDAGSLTLGNGASTCTTPAGSESSACKYALTVSSTTYYFTALTGSDTSALDYYLNQSGNAVAAGSALTVTVYYTIASSAGTGAPPTVTATSTLYAQIAYAAAGSASAETSAAQTAAETNYVIADARIDQYKAQSQVTSSPPTGENIGDITYAISGHNGGSEAVKDLQSVKALLGGAWPTGGGNGGVLLSDKIPQFSSAPLTLSNISGSNAKVSLTVNTAYGFGSGAKAYIVYSTSSSGASWTVASGTPATGTTAWTIPTSATVYYLGVLIAGGSCASTSGFELCTDSNSTANGNSNVASFPAVQYSFTVAQPTGTGSANANSITNVGDAIGGDNQTTEHILGPGISSGTADSASASALTTSGQGINYTSTTLTAGASNAVQIQSLATYGTLTGPYDASGTNKGSDATGSYDGVAGNTNNDDFTAVPFGESGDGIVNTSTTLGTPATTVKTSASQTLCVAHTLYNNGNKDDQDSILANVPAAYSIPTTSSGTSVTGWTVGIYSDSGCSSALGGATDGSSTSTATNVSISSGATLQYYVKYVVPASTTYFTRFDATITATSNGDGTKQNATHDELYSSFIALTTLANVTATNCPSGTSPSLPATSSGGAQVCPGGTIVYSIDYRNLVMGLSSTNASFAQAITHLNGLVVTDDGTLSTTSQSTTPNWATFTTGLQSAPADSDSNSAARASSDASLFTYWTNIPASGGGSTTFSAGGTKFTDAVGGTSSFQLAPKGYFQSGISGNPALPVSEPANLDWQGTISFTLSVK